MKKGLRSRLAQYGDEEFALFLRRGFLKGAGFTDDALDRPIVGMLSTASDFNPCHETAPQVAEAVARGVRMAGALPFVFPTISLHEAFSFPTSMLLRNLMAMDVEEMIARAAARRGGADRRLRQDHSGRADGRDQRRHAGDRASTVGSMLAGRHEGTRLGACTDCRRLWAAYRAGTLDGANLDRAHDQLMPTSGTCMVMGTASTMACLAETLGFTLPGAATAPAVSSDRTRFAEATGTRAADDGDDRRAAAERTAHQGGAAQRVGGAAGDLAARPTRWCISPPSRAAPASPTTSHELDRVGRDVPVLLDLKPAGSNFMEDFHAAGGLPALWRRLKDHLDLSAKLVNGETIGDVIARWPAYVDDKVIRPLDNPVVKSEAIAILTRQPRAAGRRDQACRGDAGAVPARGPGAGVRLARRSRSAHRRSEPRRHAADR